MDDLKKIDLLKERFDVSYSTAREALESAEGDVIAALVKLEENRKWWRTKENGCCQGFWSNLKDGLKQTNSAKVKIKRKGETVLQIPLTLSLVALTGALSNRDLAMVVGIGSLGAMLKGYYLELEGHEEQEDEFIFIS